MHHGGRMLSQAIWRNEIIRCLLKAVWGCGHLWKRANQRTAVEVGSQSENNNFTKQCGKRRGNWESWCLWWLRMVCSRQMRGIQRWPGQEAEGAEVGTGAFKQSAVGRGQELQNIMAAAFQTGSCRQEASEPCISSCLLLCLKVIIRHLGNKSHEGWYKQHHEEDMERKGRTMQQCSPCTANGISASISICQVMSKCWPWWWWPWFSCIHGVT